MEVRGGDSASGKGRESWRVDDLRLGAGEKEGGRKAARKKEVKWKER